MLDIFNTLVNKNHTESKIGRQMPDEGLHRHFLTGITLNTFIFEHHMLFMFKTIDKQLKKHLLLMHIKTT